MNRLRPGTPASISSHIFLSLGAKHSHPWMGNIGRHGAECVSKCTLCIVHTHYTLYTLLPDLAHSYLPKKKKKKSAGHFFWSATPPPPHCPYPFSAHERWERNFAQTEEVALATARIRIMRARAVSVCIDRRARHTSTYYRRTETGFTLLVCSFSSHFPFLRPRARVNGVW